MSADEIFKNELIELIPFLRAFARSLSGGNAALADDISQEALAKAWAARDRFEPGTNLKAWTYRILRNVFLTDRRSAWRDTPFDPEAHDHLQSSAPVGSAALELHELRHALMLLDLDQREALILVGAGGLSYEEAAAICDVAVGTMKSRVSRGRDRLATLLSGAQMIKPCVERHDSIAQILDLVSALKANGPAPRDPSGWKPRPAAPADRSKRLRIKARPSMD